METDVVLKALGEILTKHSFPSGTPSTPYLHGPGGSLSYPGIARDVLHTRMSGRGLGWVLPVFPSNEMYPLFAYITGYQNPSESNPTGPCDEPPVAGAMKTCLQTAPFGRYSYKTREMEINRVGQLNNRGEFNDLRLLNDPIVPELGATIFPSISGSAQLSAASEVLARWLEMGVKFVNKLGRQVYTGNPTNNTAGGYAEFMGIDLLIGTTKVDAISNTDCPSLDSDVKDFNYGKVDAENADPGIVKTLTTMWRLVNHIANQTGLDPATWTFVMRTALFWEITDIWPCHYLSYRCTSNRDTAGIDPVGSYSSEAAIRLRDQMRNGKYLLVDGVEIPIILDDFIVEESSADTNKLGAGCFASDIYLVPLTALGGRPVTYFEYFNYQNGPMDAVSDGRLGQFFWTDGGRYMWHSKPPLNWCVQWIAKTEPRIVLRTPQIAARLTNVAYCPLQHPRDVHPDDDYWVDGGVKTGYSAPSLYSDWNGGAK
jgi:hypothetical protein